MELSVCVLPGDGIGPSVTRAALGVLRATADRFGHELSTAEAPVGWTAVQEAGSPLPETTLRRCRRADAVLLGAVGDPAAAHLPPDRRPEAGLLRLRRELGCWANLRPARVRPGLVDRSPLRDERARGTDVVLVRELAGGLYYGEPRWSPGNGREDAGNTMRYAPEEIRRVARVAFRLAESRGGSVTSVDKANVLEVSALWRRTVEEVAADHPGVKLRHLLVDRAAMDLLLEPTRFDVLLTSNLFGDVLSDELAGVVGSVGLLGSASLGDGAGLFEPVHGSAPDLEPEAANPVGGTISAAMLLRHGFGLHREASVVERAVDEALARGPRPADLADPGEETASTEAFAAAVARRVGEAADAGSAHLPDPADRGDGARPRPAAGEEERAGGRAAAHELDETNPTEETHR